jgi:hypothetical protein
MQLCCGTAAAFVCVQGCNELTSCCLLWMMLLSVCISSSASLLPVQQYDPLQCASDHKHHVPPKQFSADMSTASHFLPARLCPVRFSIRYSALSTERILAAVCPLCCGHMDSCCSRNCCLSGCRILFCCALAEQTDVCRHQPPSTVEASMLQRWDRCRPHTQR